MKIRLLSFILIILACCQIIQAIPAYPFPFEVSQPDGTVITIQMQGDEHGFLILTDDGYPLVQNPITATYEYAKISEGILVGSGIAAAPRQSRTAEAVSYLESMDIEAMTRIAESQWNRGRQSHSNSIHRAPQRVLINDFPSHGTQKSLVILVEFSDKKFVSVADPHSYYNNMLNQEGFTHENGAHGSARDFYHACSMGQFDPQFDVVGPVELPHPQGYYGGDSMTLMDTTVYKMVIEACVMIDDDVDFSQYDLNGDSMVDNIYFFYAGYGQADSGESSAIWPHSAKLQEDWHLEPLVLDGVIINRYATSNEIRYGTFPNFQPVGIGTFVHEFGHVLGIADHYDTMGQSGRIGVQAWDTMAAASYHDNQNTPPLFSAFERGELGWLNYSDITPTQEGVLKIPVLSEANEALRIIVPDTDGREYFIMENRQQRDWDSFLPGHGMLVWHIDMDEDAWFENMVNVLPNHQRIDIIEADGSETATSYTGDPFPGSKKVTQYDFYGWNSGKFYSFDYVEETDSTINVLLGGTVYKPAVPQLTVSDVHGSMFTLSWPAIEEAKTYLLTVSEIGDDGSMVSVDAYDQLSLEESGESGSITINDLTPQTRYIVEMTAHIGSYASDKAIVDVTTGVLEFFEMRPIATDASNIVEGGFTAHWEAMALADISMNTVMSRQKAMTSLTRPMVCPSRGRPAQRIIMPLSLAKKRLPCSWAKQMTISCSTILMASALQQFHCGNAANPKTMSSMWKPSRMTSGSN